MLPSSCVCSTKWNICHHKLCCEVPKRPYGCIFLKVIEHFLQVSDFSLFSIANRNFLYFSLFQISFADSSRTLPNTSNGSAIQQGIALPLGHTCILDQVAYKGYCSSLINLFYPYILANSGDVSVKFSPLILSLTSIALQNLSFSSSQVSFWFVCVIKPVSPSISNDLKDHQANFFGTL